MSNEPKYFTNFKVHTQYSICEGAIKIPELAEYCKVNKIPVSEVRVVPFLITGKWSDFGIGLYSGEETSLSISTSKVTIVEEGEAFEFFILFWFKLQLTSFKFN